MPHHVFGTKFGRYYNGYVRRTSFYFQKPSFNWFWWKWCRSLNFNRLLSPLYFLCGSILNLFFFRIINNNECKNKWCNVPLKVPQSFSKSFSYSSRMPQCFYNFLSYIFAFSRTLIAFMKFKRWSWCKRFNIDCSSCSKNFLSNSLQSFFLCFFLFPFFSQFCLPFTCFLS